MASRSLAVSLVLACGWGSRVETSPQALGLTTGATAIATPVLAKAAKDGSPAVRAAAVMALGAVGGTEGHAIIQGALTDRSAAVVLAAITAAGKAKLARRSKSWRRDRTRSSAPPPPPPSDKGGRATPSS